MFFDFGHVVQLWIITLYALQPLRSTLKFKYNISEMERLRRASRESNSRICAREWILIRTKIRKRGCLLVRKGWHKRVLMRFNNCNGISPSCRLVIRSSALRATRDKTHAGAAEKGAGKRKNKGMDPGPTRFSPAPSSDLGKHCGKKHH